MEYDLSYDDSPSLKQTLADLLRGMSKKQAYQELGQGIQNTAKVIPSVVESLGRGAIAQVPGTFGDISQLARQFAPETMQSVMGNRVAPTTEEILAKIPRLNPDYQGSSQHETIGGLISPAMPSLLRAGAKATQNMPIGNMIKKIEPVEYRGSHQPPSPDSDVKAFFHQMDMLMPKDVYSIKGKNIYGIGDQTIDSDWWKPMMKAKGNPNYEVEVYRAVPKGVTEINSGDWVSPSRKYVQEHGENALNGEYDIISKKVPASTLTSEGYPYELGYFQPTRKDILEQAFEGTMPHYKNYENLSSVFEKAGLKVKETGSSKSNSKYVEIEDPTSGEIVTARFANHPQSGQAMTLHGPADIEIGDIFKHKSWQDAVNPILDRINKARKEFGDEPLILNKSKK
jgi:hypothetical protein